MSEQPCRWGILGAAEIARKNWQAIRLSGNGTITAVASRTVEKAARFIGDNQAHVPFPAVPAALGSYDELLTRPDVDAIYIPLPTGLRKEWVIKAAEAGKHVLVEKPVGVTTADVRDMLAACQKNNVQFMDGVMFMHSQRLPKLRAVIDDGESIGRLRRIAMQFSFNAGDEFLSNNIRVSSNLEPQGCLGDLGWYTIRFALWAMKYQMPLRVTGRLLDEAKRADSPTTVPLEFSAEMLFRDGVSASFYNSFQTENQQWAHLSGTKGFAHVPDFVLPYFGSEVGFTVSQAAFHVNGCDFNMEDHTRREAVREYSNSEANAQETNLFRTFNQLVLSKLLDPHWGEIALKTQIVLDACLESARNGSQPVEIEV
ncbi:MAG: Gfo/Idh/MocA family oxidoreductase [Planctomycetaceae bacterium]|nr:Gfo/Idh/MocA family oxidoreductase [Planctomycetaceae bacterium]